MHDDLGSSLTRIRLLAEVAKVSDSDRPNEHLHHISAAAYEVIRDMDEIVWAINPRYDKLEDLAGYFGSYAEEFLRSSNIRCHLEMPAVLPPLPLSAESRHKLFLIFKEALNNILKHADATEVWIRLECETRELQLAITDNGKGLPAHGNGRKGNGLGNISQRVNALGGTIQLRSTHHGTALECKIPLRDNPVSNQVKTHDYPQ